MPRYFFHTHDGRDLPDKVGTVLRDDESARREATKASIHSIQDLGIEFWNTGHWEMNVVDETGREVVTVRFKGTIDTA